MVHEGGHVLMALLLRDNPKQVSLFQDTSGIATVESSSRWKTLLVALSGYPLPALTSFLCFWLLQQGHAVACVWGVTIVTGLFLLCYIRNAFGILWSLSFMALHIFLLYKKSLFWIEILAQTDTFVLLADALLSCMILVRIALQHPKQSGDAYNISRITHLPSLFVALIFLSFNAFVCYCCIRRFFPAFASC